MYIHHYDLKMKDQIIQTYLDEVIKDRKGKKYIIKSSYVYGEVEGHRDYFVKGKVYNINKKQIGEFIGYNKKDMLNNAKNNIDILVYDMT